jgi:hypothetical protein
MHVTQSTSGAVTIGELAMMRRGKIFAATALTVAVLGSIGACSLWPGLENKLRRDFELMASGGDAKETEAVGTADWICFNQANDQFLYRREFLSESKRAGRCIHAVSRRMRDREQLLRGRQSFRRSNRPR